MLYYLVSALIGSLFWLVGAAKVGETVLTLKSETMCVIAANNDPNYSAFFYKEFKEFLSDTNNNNNWGGNCILVDDVDLNPMTHQILIPNGFKFRVVKQCGDVAFTHEISLAPEFETMAFMDGFDKPLVVGGKTFFMKEMNFASNYSHAMIKCLENGGILPMEKTDEFVDQMSLLVGDSTTSRFISLAYESKTYFNSEKYLMWTTGLKEWKEGESLTECPRCQNWSFGNGRSNLWAKINPAIKQYEIVSNNEIVPKFYCQYLGGNLATHKQVVVSSIYSTQDHPGKAVDGLVCDACLDFWHSASGTPGGEWISIDLGATFMITNVLFLARMESNSYRHINMSVWIDGPEPVTGTALDTASRIMCGLYPFYQRNAQLSGVECLKPTFGHRVTILNPSNGIVIHFMEVAVHGINSSFVRLGTCPH